MSNKCFTNKNFADPNVFKRSLNKINQKGKSGDGKIANPTSSNASMKRGAASNEVAKNQSVKPAKRVNDAPSNGGGTFNTESSGRSKNIPEYMLKHPLHNTWTLWYLEPDRSKNWEDTQHVVSSFNTVEDFWSLYNHIKPSSEIKLGSDYSLFKKGVRPMWEDAANRKGGRWILTLNKYSKCDLDRMWCDVMLCLIGEIFDNSDEVCGAVVNIRHKNNRISIWTANGNNKDAALEIGQKLRVILSLSRSELQYNLHKDTMVKGCFNVKSIYNL